MIRTATRVVFLDATTLPRVLTFPPGAGIVLCSCLTGDQSEGSVQT
jgi:hypothetical protein